MHLHVYVHNIHIYVYIHMQYMCIINIWKALQHITVSMHYIYINGSIWHDPNFFVYMKTKIISWENPSTCQAGLSRGYVLQCR